MPAGFSPGSLPLRPSKKAWLVSLCWTHSWFSFWFPFKTTKQGYPEKPTPPTCLLLLFCGRGTTGKPPASHFDAPWCNDNSPGHAATELCTTWSWTNYKPGSKDAESSGGCGSRFEGGVRRCCLVPQASVAGIPPGPMFFVGRSSSKYTYTLLGNLVLFRRPKGTPCWGSIKGDPHKTNDMVETDGCSFPTLSSIYTIAMDAPPN